MQLWPREWLADRSMRMRKRRFAVLTIGTLILALVPLVPAASADTGAFCPKVAGDCVVEANKPGGGASGGGSGGGQNPCVYSLAKPQPPYSDPVWPRNSDGTVRQDGAVYVRMCLHPSMVDPIDGSTVDGFWTVDLVWFADPPASVDPEEIARSILPLRGPDIQLSVKPGRAATVGVPVWLWNEASELTWGPVHRTAEVTGLQVQATARALGIRWDMGDGRLVNCATSGTPYEARYGGNESPDCGHTYRHPSRALPDGQFTITATTTWEVNWSASNGESGSFTVTRSSTRSIEVVEAVVVVE